MSLLAPQGRNDAMAANDREKTLLRFPGRARPLQAGNGVVRNEVHAGADAAGVAGEKMGLFFAVVYAGDEDVFEIDPLLIAAGIIIASGEQGRQVELSVYGHDSVADFVGGPVK